MKISKSEFMKRVNKARRMNEKAQWAEQELFDYLDKCFPNTDLEDIYYFATNADNIKQAITCYIAYGEDCPDEIYKTMAEVETYE